MNIVTVPRQLMRLTQFDWDIDWRGQGGQETNAGSRQIVYNAFPRWIGRAKMRLNADAIRVWRAIRAEAQGRVCAYRVPMIDPLTYDIGQQNTDLVMDGITGLTGASFSTGQNYEYQPFVRAVDQVEVGGTSLRIDASALPQFAPMQGHIYSHADLPFLVTSVASQGGGVYQLGVRMAVRATIYPDDPIQLIPYGIFMATTDLTGAMSFGVDRISDPTFDFVELQR